MTFKLHNSLGGKVEEFKPIKSGEVSMYHCGPTVYGPAHIGNFRTFVMNDILRRSCEFLGYKVTQVMNITDIDDKTVKGSIAEGISLSEFTKKYEEKFLADLKSLNVLTPHKLMLATENIGEMISLISSLIEKGFAYVASDGVYMSISKVSNYGELASLKHRHEEKNQARVNNDEYEKENPQDFALWKFQTEEEKSKNIGWETPWGNGRPGWHIECSVMALKAFKDTFGETIDIHTGGEDLLFPHHTNEIAQSESATGKKFVNYWLHVAFMNVAGDKMSKSKRNFYVLEDLEKEGVSALAFRFLLLQAHYRSKLNFTLESAHASQAGLIRYISEYKNLKIKVALNERSGINNTNGTSSTDGNEAQKTAKTDVTEEENAKDEYINEFKEKISSDLNITAGLALAWEVLKDKALSPASKIDLIEQFDMVFGLNIKDFSPTENEIKDAIEHDAKSKNIPPEITVLAELREESRKAKDWQKADALRDEILARGYNVIDGDGGKFEIMLLED